MSLELSPLQESEIIERAASVGINRELIRRALHLPTPAKQTPNIAPNEEGLAMLRALRERQRNHPISSNATTQELLTEARAGAMYGYEPTE